MYKLPSAAVVNPTGHPVHSSVPEEFLYKPLTQGEQRNVENENACPASHERFPVNQASTRCTSASESFTLYTRTDWIAKSDVSPEIKPVFIASLSNA
jgi:hypothetical protein